MASILTLALRNTLPKVRLGTAQAHDLSKIGKRDVVGYGWNGQAIYFDRVDYPMPAVRFREETKQIKLLREKEKGDWKKLNLEEKKALYRHSFCQTFAEMKAPTGEWKMVVGMLFLACAGAIGVSCLMNIFVYDQKIPTLSEDRVKAQLKRMLDAEMNPIFGLSSKWDYENKKWK